MPHTRDVIMVQMSNEQDRFTTRPVVIPVHAIQIAAMVPDFADASLVNIDVSPHPHVFNYPAPNYYRVKPGNNPWPHKFPQSYGYVHGGILAEFRFDDADGTTITDEAEGYVLTEQGDPTFQVSAAAAGLGKGVTLDGVGDMFDAPIADVPNLDITTGDFSIEIVGTFTSGVAAADIVEHRAVTDGVGFSVGFDGSDDLIATIEDEDGAVSLTPETDVADGTLKHIVVTFDRDGDMTPYINGVAGTAADISAVEKTLSNAGRFAIGGDSDRANPLTGDLNFVRVYNRVLSADEVLHNYRILVGNQWPGWIKVVDQADGAAADVVASAADPAGVDVTMWLSAFRGMYARFNFATEQTTAGLYEFGWVFSGVT